VEDAAGASPPNSLKLDPRLGAAAAAESASMARMVMGPVEVVMTVSRSWRDFSLAGTLLMLTTCIPSLSLDFPNNPSGLTLPITVDPSTGLRLRLIPSFWSGASLTTVAVTLRETG
jgi:hypothetical protein